MIGAVTRHRPTGLAPYPPAEADELVLPVFVAAGLIHRSTVSNLLEREVSPMIARLEGHRRVELADIGWAVLVPADGEWVEGEIFCGLEPEDLRRLDAYRGVREGLYRRALALASVEGHDALVRVFIYLPTERTLRGVGDR
jgi:hypothetical protein